MSTFVTSLCLALTLVAVAPAQDDAPPERNAELAQFLQVQHDFWLRRSPVTQSYRGLKTNYGKWDRVTDAWARIGRDAAEVQLMLLDRNFGETELSASDQLELDLWKASLEQRVVDYRWREHRFPVHHHRGLHTFVPQFLSSVHRIDDISDAEAYIERLGGVWPMFREQLVTLRDRQARGVLPLAAGFPKMIAACRNVLAGAPFDGSKTDSLLLADFRRKVAEIVISDKDRTRLLAAANDALLQSVLPAYRRMIDWLEAAQENATNHGIWNLTDGDEAYAAALAHHTTTNLSADEIHALGLEHVARIHDELDAIAERVGFTGTRAEFFEHLRTSDDFYLPDTDEGRAEYLARVHAVVDEMRAALPSLFITLPETPLVVKAVEAYREKAAGKAFYERGSPDGSRPGTYYANLSNMRDMPTYQLAALAYHEAIPGHHMQISIAQELDDVAEFRRHEIYTAYAEGWALYCEELPREIGMYDDPYDDAGRLAMELWRACRLVVDTGLHAKRWTREDAVEYLRVNTPNSLSDCERAIDRYLVMPGQATSYMVGKLKIVELRARAEEALGDAFDLREFHDVVLRNGSVPLSFLERIVNEWIASKG